MSEDIALDESAPSKVMTGDVAQLLRVAAALVGHPLLTHDSVKIAQARVKAFIADKGELQGEEILIPLDQILKYGAAAQVSATYIPAPFDPKDYVTLAPLEENQLEANGSVPEIA